MGGRIGLLGNQIKTAIDHAAVTADRYGHTVLLVGPLLFSGVGRVAKGIHFLGRKLFPAFFTGSSAYMTHVKKMHGSDYGHPFYGPKLAKQEISLHTTMNRFNADLKEKSKEFEKKFKSINHEEKINLVNLMDFMIWSWTNESKVKNEFEKMEFKTLLDDKTTTCQNNYEEFNTLVWKYHDDLWEQFKELDQKEKTNFLHKYSSSLLINIDFIRLNKDKDKESMREEIKIIENQNFYLIDLKKIEQIENEKLDSKIDSTRSIIEMWKEENTE